MNDPKEVDRMMAASGAKAAGYNGVAFSHNIRRQGGRTEAGGPTERLDLVAIVMGGIPDRITSRPAVKDALFVASGRKATFFPDNPTACST